MNLFQILEVTCDDDIRVVVDAVKFVFTLIQWAIPLVLIVLGTIDMFKAMANGDEKATKEVQKKFGRRLIYAVVAFLVPFIISLTFTLVGKMIKDENAKKGSEVYGNFITCWDGSSGDIDTTNDDKNKTGTCVTDDGNRFTSTAEACESVGGYFKADE